MRRTIWTNLLLTCAISSLAACGGGGGGGPGFASTPPPPPPPPPPPNYVDIFPAVTTSTEFAVVGNEACAGCSAIQTSGFAVRFDAASGAYIIDLPSYDPGKFDSQSETSSYWGGQIQVNNEGTQTLLSVLKPLPGNPEIELTYTTMGAFYDYEFGCCITFGDLAFGMATPDGSVPVSGTAAYDGLLSGHTDGAEPIGGTVSMDFDFGAGTLAGTMDPILFRLNGSSVSLGQYNFVNTVFGIGSTTFSGGLSRSGAPSLGSFNGLFTGPAAQELMARWAAPYLNPDSSQWSDMFGVWVAKKDGGP